MQKNEDYWKALFEVGREVLDQVAEVGFGMSDVSIKYADGKPVIIVRSHTENRKYGDNMLAITDLTNRLTTDAARGFNGTKTFTAVFDHGRITRLLIDDYRNTAL